MRFGLSTHAKKRIGERIGSIKYAKALFRESKRYKREWEKDGFRDFYKNGDVVFIVKTDEVTMTVITVLNKANKNIGR